MPRPLRTEFNGACYHISARGNRKADIFHDVLDRRHWLDLLGETCSRHRFHVHAFCQMTNHYHLMVETEIGGLGLGLGFLNSRYAEWFNWRHDLVGHLFQGRYHASLINKEAYFMEVIRYVVLNPLRANMVTSVDDWPWSSHMFMMGQRDPPPWFHPDEALRLFGPDPQTARRDYRDFLDLPHDAEALLARARVRHSKRQPRAYASCRESDPEVRNASILSLYKAGGISMPRLAEQFKLSTRTIERVIAASRR